MNDHLRDLPARLTTTEVRTLARWTLRTFQRRRRTGKFLVPPVDRGPNGELTFPRDETLRALGLIPDAQPPQAEEEKPRVSVDAIRERRARAIRGRTPPGGRDVARPVRGAEATPTLRLVVDSSAPD